MKYFLIFAAMFSTAALATNSTSIGQTWGFAEKNAIEEIHEHISKNKDAINARGAEVKKRLEKSAWEYKAPNLEKLPRTKKTNTYYADMNYALEFDIKDQTGNIIFPKGHKYNIADFARLPYKILVIDGTDKEQMAWYLKSAYVNAIDTQVMTTDGTIKYIQSQIKNRPFYYFDKRMVARFQIKTVPSLIEQEGNKIKVTQIAIMEKDK